MSFKLHPLHTAAMHAERMRDLGAIGYHEWLAERRCTARTTSIAFRAIADALLRDGVAIPLRDHTGTAAGHECLALTCAAVIRDSMLDHLHIIKKDGDYYIIFEVQPAP